MTAFLTDADAVPEINTTPLIDVLLVLLVMLIVTIPAPLRLLDVAVPAVGASVSPRPQAVRLTVAADGSWRWNDEAVADAADLDRRLQQVADQLGDRPAIHLRADPAARYGRVVAVIAVLHRHPAVDFALVRAAGRS